MVANGKYLWGNAILYIGQTIYRLGYLHGHCNRMKVEAIIMSLLHVDYDCSAPCLFGFKFEGIRLA